MTDVMNVISTAIMADAQLRANTVLMTLIEGVNAKRGMFASEYEFAGEVRKQLAGFNEYLKHDGVTALLVKIDEQLASIKPSVYSTVNSQFSEVNLFETIEQFKSAMAYKEPAVKNYVDQLSYELTNTTRPHFVYLPSMINVMSTYKTDAKVNECVTYWEKYVDTNRSKLIMLESVMQLDMVSGGFYRPISDTIKKFIAEGNYSSAQIGLAVKNYPQTPIVSTMLQQLAILESENKPGFNLGNGNNFTKVYNYIGPALKNDDGITIFFEDTFLRIGREAINESAVQRSLGTSGEISVTEIKAVKVFESAPEFYTLAKSFEYLNFAKKNDGISTKLRHVNIDFKLNESGQIDLYLNDMHIADPSKINYSELFILENGTTRNCSSTLFNNVEKIYNVEFVKFLVSESASAMIVNIGDDFYVYDKVDEKTSNIYKTNGAGVSKYVAEKFNYDVSKLFSAYIDEETDRIRVIESKKQTVSDALAKLGESMYEIDNAMKRRINEKDRSTLLDLREKIEREMIQLQNTYVLLEHEAINDTSTTVGLQIGDDVTTHDGKEGKVVDAAGANQYIVNLGDRMEKLDVGSLTKVEPKTQSVTESKKEDGQQQQQQQGEQVQQQEEQQEEESDDKKEKKDKKPAKKEKKSGTCPKELFDVIKKEYEMCKAEYEKADARVKSAFDWLFAQHNIFISQIDQYMSLGDKLDSVLGDSDVDTSALYAKLTKKAETFAEIMKEISGEFQAAKTQAQEINEGQITDAYNKYLTTIASVADKLISKLNSFVQRNGTELIDLNAQIDINAAKAQAAKAKLNLSKLDVKTIQQPQIQDGAGVQPQTSETAQHQAAQTSQEQAQEHVDQTPQAQSQEHQSQQPVQQPVENEHAQVVQAPNAQPLSQPQSAQDILDTWTKKHQPQQSQQIQQPQTQQPQQQQTTQPVQAQTQQPQDVNIPLPKDEQSQDEYKKRLQEMTNEQLAQEAATQFKMPLNEAMKDVEKERETYVEELLYRQRMFK